MAPSTHTQQLSFLKDKIEQIGSAIFFNQSDSVLKLPTSLVSAVKVDDYGYVWFFIKKPKQHIHHFENGFPAQMDFFKKGIEYFLKVTGKGWVVSDPEEISSFFENQEDLDRAAISATVLVKMKIMKVEYFETQVQLKSSWWQNAAAFFSGWFRPSNVGASTYFPAS